MKTHFAGAASSMGRRMLPFAALLFAVATVQAQAPPVNPPHDPRVDQLLQDLGKAKMISEVNLSPDGKFIAWSSGGRRRSGGHGIQLASLPDAASPRTITGCGEGMRGEESDAIFSPDSSKLAFFSDCTQDHKTAIFLADVSGTAAPHALAELNGVAEDLSWSPDGKYLTIIYVEGATRQPSPLAAEKPPAGVIGVEGLEVKRIALVDAAGGQLRQITPDNLYVYEYSWSKDATKLTYVAAPPPGENNWWVAKLYTQPIDGHPTAILDTQTVPGPLHGLQIAVPRWSPDGSRIAFIGGLMSDQGSTGGDIWTIPATGGDPVDQTPNRNATPGWFTWMDNQRLGIAEVKGGDSHLFVYNLATHQDSPDDSLTLPDTIGAGGLHMRVATSADDNTIAFVRQSFSEPPEV